MMKSFSNRIGTLLAIAGCTLFLLSSLQVYAAGPVNMKLLVLSGDAKEPGFAAITTFLKQIGVPHDAVVLAPGLVNLPPLVSGSTGNYQGIILTTGTLTDGNMSMLAPEGWLALDDYTLKYGVRTLSYYTWPEARYGLAWAQQSGGKGTLKFASGAAAIFPYLVQSQSIPVDYSWIYMATAVAAAGETTTPILTGTLASSGTKTAAEYTVGVVHTDAQGREYLALTMDNSPYLFHSNALSYGLISWVTKGIFLGSARVYLSPQVDDYFLANSLFDPSKSQCKPAGFMIDPTFDDSACPTVRMDDGDVNVLSKWQSAVNADPLTARFRVGMAFNGFGTTIDGGASSNDPLVQATKLKKSQFYWVNHTWDHEDLDCYEPVPNSNTCKPADFSQSLMQVVQNGNLGNQLFGTHFDAASMVTPRLSGQQNANFLHAAAMSGIRYLVTDLARMNPPPSPNTGYDNSLEPSIFMIPRRATNTFFNAYSLGKVGNEAELYNYFYGPSGLARLPDGSPFYATKQTYADIVERESNNIIGYMLQYSAFPLMYHQSNLVCYQGDKSLFTDVMNTVFKKWKAISNLPVWSYGQTDLGKILKKRMDYDASQVTAVLTPGVGITLKMPKSNLSSAVIPITGICETSGGKSCETYGGRPTTEVTLKANSSATVAVPAAAAGSTAPAGTTPTGLATSATTLPQPQSPAARMGNIQSSLLAIKTPLMGSHDRAHLENAMSAFADCFNNALWLTPSQLDKRDGKWIFESIRDGIGELEDINNPSAQKAAQEVVMRVVDFSQGLVEQAIADAYADGLDKKSLDKAKKELAGAVKDIADERFDEAFKHLKSAWELVH